MEDLFRELIRWYQANNGLAWTLAAVLIMMPLGVLGKWYRERRIERMVDKKIEERENQV